MMFHFGWTCLNMFSSIFHMNPPYSSSLSRGLPFFVVLGMWPTRQGFLHHYNPPGGSANYIGAKMSCFFSVDTKRSLRTSSHFCLPPENHACFFCNIWCLYYKYIYHNWSHVDIYIYMIPFFDRGVGPTWILWTTGQPQSQKLQKLPAPTES